jgi:hypothetical protein
MIPIIVSGKREIKQVKGAKAIPRIIKINPINVNSSMFPTLQTLS